MLFLSNSKPIPQKRKRIFLVFIRDVEMLESRPFHKFQMVQHTSRPDIHSSIRSVFLYPVSSTRLELKTAEWERAHFIPTPTILRPNTILLMPRIHVIIHLIRKFPLDIQTRNAIFLYPFQ